MGWMVDVTMLKQDMLLWLQDESQPNFMRQHWQPARRSSTKHQLTPSPPGPRRRAAGSPRGVASRGSPRAVAHRAAPTLSASLDASHVDIMDDREPPRMIAAADASAFASPSHSCHSSCSSGDGGDGGGKGGYGSAAGLSTGVSNGAACGGAVSSVCGGTLGDAGSGTGDVSKIQQLLQQCERNLAERRAELVQRTEQARVRSTAMCDDSKAAHDDCFFAVEREPQWVGADHATRVAVRSLLLKTSRAAGRVREAVDQLGVGVTDAMTGRFLASTKSLLTRLLAELGAEVNAQVEGAIAPLREERRRRADAEERVGDLERKVVQVREEMEGARRLEVAVLRRLLVRALDEADNDLTLQEREAASKLAEAVAAIEKAMAEAMEEAQAARAKLEAEVEELQKALAAERSQNAAMRGAESESEKLRKEVDRLTAELGAMTTAKQEAEDALAEAEAAHAEEIERLEAEFEEERQEMQREKVSVLAASHHMARTSLSLSLSHTHTHTHSLTHSLTHCPSPPPPRRSASWPRCASTWST